MRNFFQFFFLIMLSLCLQNCQDKCKNVTCSGVGTCNDEGVCECNVGYQGDNCEIEISAKFEGTYNADEVCDSGNSTYTTEITPINASQFEVTNFSWQKVTILATVTADDEGSNSFTFSTNVSGKIFAGSGTIDQAINEIDIDYGITENNVTDSCGVILTL